MPRLRLRRRPPEDRKSTAARAGANGGSGAGRGWSTPAAEERFQFSYPCFGSRGAGFGRRNPGCGGCGAVLGNRSALFGDQAALGFLVVTGKIATARRIPETHLSPRRRPQFQTQRLAAQRQCAVQRRRRGLTHVTRPRQPLALQTRWQVLPRRVVTASTPAPRGGHRPISSARGRRATCSAKPPPGRRPALVLPPTACSSAAGGPPRRTRRTRPGRSTPADCLPRSR